MLNIDQIKIKIAWERTFVDHTSKHTYNKHLPYVPSGSLFASESVSIGLWNIPYFRNEYKFIRVSSLFGRYFYNTYILIATRLKLCSPLMSRIITYFHVYRVLVLYFPITYRNAAVFCQSECACLHKTVNTAIFFVKSNEITQPKRKALMQMCRVVPQTKVRICVTEIEFVKCNDTSTWTNWY